MIFGDELGLRSDQHVILNSDTSQVKKRATVVDEDVLSDRGKPAKVGGERGEYSGGFIQFLIKDPAQDASGSGDISDGIELTDQL